MCSTRHTIKAKIIFKVFGCVSSAFTGLIYFANKSKKSPFSAEDKFICTFYINSFVHMFTFICADVLCGSYPHSGIPKTVFMELIEIDTVSLEFSFNKIMCKKTG